MRAALVAHAAPASDEVPTVRTTARRRVVALVSAVLASLAVVSAAVAAPAHADEGATFVNSINAARSTAGKSPYTTASDLQGVAAAWAAHLASTGVLAHNPDLRAQVSGWRYVGENVGVGPSATDVHTAFMNSPAHRANILDSDFTQVAVATVSGGGRLWVVEVFRRPTVVAPAPRATPAPAATPAARPTTQASPRPTPPSAAPRVRQSARTPSTLTADLLRLRARSASGHVSASRTLSPAASAFSFADGMTALGR